ncbi:DEAD/DEAH box helicase [Lujinxingia sediminis]|uniref:DEAD/DEAH box helicase n=1 Tax=Lujinxingia sediminis TaxID=2480984 RepID=A0ABY0CWL6_9DELT|nr:DEAD/DEAH box helicase [Lujinxingia sediminis]RVU48277.1 DEAD/DEAH box helicase [Lujinxingia sediminis]
MLTTAEHTFDDFYLSDEMRRALDAIGYTRPTKAQVAAIPLILAGIDLILQSQTGSGKTAAFGIPMIEMLEPVPGRIDVLVLAPTRELAQQVCNEFERLGQFKRVKATAIYGGTSYERQYEELEKSSIVVATPGRLIDLCERGKIDLSQLRLLCLDEADEMLSMGFRDDIEAIMAYLPEERQSLLFSATITDEIKALGNKTLFYPENVLLSTDSVASVDVAHYYYPVRGVGRPRDLIKVLEYEEPDSAIIFANTKDDTFMVTSFLKRHGYRADVLNGDLPQKEREKTLAALRDGKIDYIVATDVAARGIDISDLSHVINFVLPDSAEVYIHRTGRTGRAGKKGKAISLIAPNEVATFFQVRKMYSVNLIEQSLPTPVEIMKARQRRGLTRIANQLESRSDLPYGAHMGIAEILLNEASEGSELDPVRTVARLLAIAERVQRSQSVTREAATADVKVEAPKVEEKKVEAPKVEETKAEAPKVEETKAEAPKVEEKKVEAPKVEEKKVEAPKVEEKKAEEKKIEAKEESTEVSEEAREEGTGRRRRRRGARRRSRGSRGSSAAPQEVQEEAVVKPSADESTPAPESKPRRERTRRRSRTARNGSSQEGVQQIATPSVPTPVAVAAPAAPAPRDTRKMYLNLGSATFGSDEELVTMLCYMSGMDPEDFGELQMENTYSFIHVRREYFRDVVVALNGQVWEGNNLTAEAARK